jgi:cysteinyl-tRNA synthetase
MKLYNTLTRSVEPFAPLAPPTVTLYVCGPTVYDDPHIGHARSAYLFDVSRRYLEYKGFQVHFVRNVTDVDDKIIEKAKQEVGAGGRGQGAGELSATCQEVARRYLTSYHQTLERLGVGRPTEEPLATQHVVPEMTDLISKLLIQGAAYEAGGDVYFSVRKFPGYGKLSNRTPDELRAGARVEPGEHKQDPLDFALWKAAKPGEPSWDSPWGKGRPGWHIECSAMSTKCLGDAFDIHGGGIDLIFPHHENEIAQAHAAGKPFAKYWVHNGLLTVKGEKMSKSAGNYLTLEQVLNAYPHPDYLKIFFLKAHYRSPIDYSPAKMDEAKKNWEGFARFFQHYDQKTAGVSPTGGTDAEPADISRKRQLFEEAMDDDFNTPRALSVLFDVVNLGHRVLESSASMKLAMARGAYDVLVGCGMVLGLFLQGTSEEDPTTLERIQRKIAERDAARKANHFAKADEIRNGLNLEGVLLTDTPHGTLWRRQR